MGFPHGMLVLLALGVQSLKTHEKMLDWVSEWKITG